MKNVLVFSCGAIPAIDINFAMRGNKEYKIYGASSYDDHGLYVYENYIGGVPFLYEEDFLSPADILGKSLGVLAYNIRLMTQIAISTVFDVLRSFKKSCALISVFKL